MKETSLLARGASGARIRASRRAPSAVGLWGVNLRRRLVTPPAWDPSPESPSAATAGLRACSWTHVGHLGTRNRTHVGHSCSLRDSQRLHMRTHEGDLVMHHGIVPP